MHKTGDGAQEKRKGMTQSKEQLDKLFSDLAASLKKYQPGESVSFYWLFDSNEQLAAFVADPRFKQLCGDCETKKSTQLKSMKPVFKWMVKIPKYP
jgi:hypothetical protein